MYFYALLCSNTFPSAPIACLREMKNHRYLWGRHRFEFDSLWFQERANNVRFPHPPTFFEPLIDSEHAAALIRVHPKTLQRYARKGLVAGLRVGKLWRFRASELMARRPEEYYEALDDDAQAQ